MPDKDKLLTKERLKKVADNLGKAAPYFQAANRGILGDDEISPPRNDTIDAEYHVVRDDKKNEKKPSKKMPFLSEDTYDRLIWGDDDDAKS